MAELAPNAVDAVRIAYRNLWQRADSMRIAAQAWVDVHGREGRPDLAARCSRDDEEWMTMQRLIERAAASRIINDELARLAAAERETAAAPAEGDSDA